MAPDTPWTVACVPSQAGRTALVTGANSGIGFVSASMLAAQGARVLPACRSTDKGEEAAPGIPRRPRTSMSPASPCRHHGAAPVAHAPGLRAAVRHQASQTLRAHGASAAATAARAGCAHHRRASIASRFGRIGDPRLKQRRYSPWGAYGVGANLLFALELARRLEAAGTAVRATAAHPGVTATHLQRHSSFPRNFVNPWVMTPAEGAMPILRAATDPLARNGSYWGPTQLLGTRGPPGPAPAAAACRDQAAARHLWELSEELTGMRFPLGEPMAAPR